MAKGPLESCLYPRALESVMHGRLSLFEKVIEERNKRRHKLVS